jgi:hypothetical protein
VAQVALAQRLAVAELLARYAEAADRRLPVEAMLEVFTDDAVIDGPWGRYEGRDGIGEWVRAGQAHATSQFRHLISNVLVEETARADELAVRAYFVQYATEAEGGATPRLVYVGTYDCTARCQGETWRLSKRVVRVDGLP